jgi:hypothetical protein
MQILISAFDDVPDPRASNACHDLEELLATAFPPAMPIPTPNVLAKCAR